MTFIQPNKNHSIINRVLAVLVLLLLGGTFWLVALYNNTVNIDQNIAQAKAKLDSVGADNTAMSNKIVATLGGGDIPTVAQADGLVQEQAPRYFQVNQSWPIASQQ